MSMIFPIQNGTDIVTADDINKRPMAPVRNKKKHRMIKLLIRTTQLKISLNIPFYSMP